jgi:uncharacterized protein YbjT (DUF2867 family)
MHVLVVGANGQLGARCCAELVARGHRVRGSVRSPARGAALEPLDIDVVEADLAAGTGVARALEGVEGVLLTANAAAPRRGDSPQSLEAGLARLVDECADAGVRRLVLPSVPAGPRDRAPLFRAKRDLEERARAAPYEDVVLRFPPFMEVWLALVGSSLPLRGEPFATIGRPSPFLRSFRRATATAVEERGLMLVPGPASHRHAFISVADAARACVEAMVRPGPTAGPLDVGGPEVLSWADVSDVFADVLGRRVRILSTPAAVYAVAARLLAPVAQVPARTMALNLAMASSEEPWAPGGGGLLEPPTMTTVRQLLTVKARLPAALPTVA